MELVYLWVDKYKNIEKQGFNFSPNFDVEFTPVYEDKKLSEKSELKITPKENPLKDFFGDNINVTAIVGENGSGKSSLIKCIDTLINPKYSIYLDNNTFYFDFPTDLVNYLTKYKYERKKNNDLSNIIFLNKNFFFERPNSSLLSSIYLESKNLYAKYFKLNKNDSTININNFHERILNFILFGENYKNTFFNPTKIRIGINDFSKGYKGSKIIPKNEKVNLTNLEYQYKIYLKSYDIARRIKDEEKDILKSLQTREMKSFLKNQKEILNFNIYDDNIIFQEDIEIYKFLENFLRSNEYRLLINSKDFSFKKLKEMEFFKHNDDVKIFFYLIKIGFFEYDFIDERKTFSLLSSGEKSLFSEIIILNKEIKDFLNNNQENKSLVLILDEPETTLHPQWQKNYINEILTLLKIYEKEKILFHIIITSHSPFILSDLPKENIIFLEKGKQVYPFEDGKQTFGANIHTLLSHGFFMKDGLMGEFAKSKIDDVINYLNNKESKMKNDEDAQNIINIIGEPIIKRELQKMLDSKRLSKVDKIDKIEKDIEELQKKLEELKDANK
jgi:ABC-type multidrug transport system ATPase subunit